MLFSDEILVITAVDESNERISLMAAADALQIPYSTVWLYWSEGKIPNYERLGNLIVVKLSDVENALKSRKPRKAFTPSVN